MNKILLPLFVAHTSISEALSGRKRTRYSFPTPSYTPIVRDSIRNLQAVGASSSAIVVDTMNMQAGIISNMGCSNSSSSYRGPANAGVDESPRKQARISTAEYNAGRVANDTLGGPLFEAPDMSLLSCFNSWLNFIDKTSELVALEVTTASICDLFFKTKSADGRILRNFRSESDEAYGDSATSDTKKTSRMSKSTDNDIYLINGAENRSCSSFGEQTVGRTNVGNLNHNNANQLSIITGGQDSQSTAQKAAVMKSACNHVAASFINGLLTIDEALAAEELLEGRRAKMESKVQDLLHNLYSYPIGRGANNSMDAPDNKVRNVPPYLQPLSLTFFPEISPPLYLIPSSLPLFYL